MYKITQFGWNWHRQLFASMFETVTSVPYLVLYLAITGLHESLHRSKSASQNIGNIECRVVRLYMCALL